MRRRALLGGVAGAVAAAGATVATRALIGGASERALFLTAFHADRGRGKLMMMAHVGAAENQPAFDAAQNEILNGKDRELAIRLLLVHIQVVWDDAIVGSVTGDVPKLAPPWLAVTDGERPRLGDQVTLDDGVLQPSMELFLRQHVSLDVAWLERRVALAWCDNPELVRRIRRGIQDGSLATALARQAPAIVALEAMRSHKDPSTRDRLLALLLPPPRRPERHMINCGLAAIIMTPLGARFAAAFTEKRPKPDGGRWRRK